MSSDSDNFDDTLPIVHDDLRFADESGKEFVMVSMPQIKHNSSGYPDDRGLMTKIRVAVLAESYIAIEALRGLDVRALLPERYGKEDLIKPDKRTGDERHFDAQELVEREHMKATRYFGESCDIRVGYVISYIKRYGFDAIKLHYGEDKARSINEFMRQENRQSALDAMPGESDEKLAHIRLDVVTALLTAWAKWEETLAAHRQSKEKTKNKKRGRPSKETMTQKLVGLVDTCYESKIDFDDGDQAYLIAAHSGVNPACLWSNLTDVEKVFDYHVIYGKLARGIIWNEEEKLFFQTHVAPFMLGRKIPKTWQEQALCRQIGWQLDKLVNTARRQGKTTIFSDPRALEYFRLGADIVYRDGRFEVDPSPIFRA